MLALVRFGPRIFEEVEVHAAEKRSAEEAAERARDKSNDATETERLRRFIGVPPRSSQEHVLSLIQT